VAEVELSVANDAAVKAVAVVEFTVAAVEFMVATDEFTVVADEFTVEAVELTIALVELVFLEVKLLAAGVVAVVFPSKEALLIAEVEAAVILMMDAPESGGLVGESEFTKSCDPVESSNCPEIEACAAEFSVVGITSGGFAAAPGEVSAPTAVCTGFLPAVD